ncbi:MAG: hypothetical protein ACLGPL_11355 [Acidobacteriota bacterium]
MREGVCMHYSGIQSPRCRAGIDFQALVGGKKPGWARKLPCFVALKTEVSCASRVLPTEVDMATWEKSVGLAMAPEAKSGG